MKSVSVLNKKGQVGNLAPAILALIFAAVVLILGLVITQELRNTTNGDIAVEVANESITAFVDGVNQTLVGGTRCGFPDDVTSVVVYNETGVVVIPVANYTVYPDGNIINITDDISHYAWQVSYDYTWGGEVCVAANNTVTGLGTFADFWEIIVLAIITTLVIGLLLAVFGGRRQR